MRRPVTTLLALTVAAMLAASAGGAPSALPPQPVFVLTGGGWGHTVGMSQWGAYGQASQGRTYEQILATYYPGTQLERAERAKVRVLMAERVKSLSITSYGPFVVADARGASYPVSTGVLDLGPGLVAPIGPDGGPVTLVPPVKITPRNDVQLTLDGLELRGSLIVSRPAPGALDVVNLVGMEVYLRGVLPREMPVGWPLEALKAQAVAARTYAVSRLAPDKPWDLYPDWRSQVYAGVGAETPATTRAVQETAGTILTFEGRPAQALYYSSSGGRTSSALEIFGNDVPYLRSIPDPWDASSPNHAWAPRTFDGKRLAAALGLGEPVVDVVVLPARAGAPGAPELVRFVLRAGTPVDLRRNEVRDRLNLLSSGFELGVLALADPPDTVAPGGAVELIGAVRYVTSPQLERRTGGEPWTRVRKLRPLENGTFQVSVRPRATTTYRVVGSGQVGPQATISVAPRAA